MPSVSIKKPHHKQAHDSSCLPACCKMLLEFHGNKIAESSLCSLLGMDEYGTPMLNILMLNASLPSIKAEVHHWSLDELRDYLQMKRLLCIVAVRTKHLPYWKGEDNWHAIIVHGFSDDNFLVNDPNYVAEEFQVPIKAFLLAWAEPIPSSPRSKSADHQPSARSNRDQHIK